MTQFELDKVAKSSIVEGREEDMEEQFKLSSIEKVVDEAIPYY